MNIRRKIFPNGRAGNINETCFKFGLAVYYFEELVEERISDTK